MKAQRTSSMRTFYILLGAVAVCGIAAISYSAAKGNDAAPVTTTDPTITAAQAEGYLYGSPTAPVHILEFADFECPACGQFATVTEPDVRSRILATGLANLRFFDFPLPQHKNSMAASNAAACAAEQGRFWEMHDRLFNGQLEWNGEATDKPRKVFVGYAKDIGLDTDKWGQCFDTQKFRTRILGNRAEAEQRRVAQTPTFVIGNKMLPGVVPYDQFKAYVDSATQVAAAAAVARAESTSKAAVKK